MTKKKSKVGKKVIYKKKSSVQEFADTIKDNPNAIIKWAEREIEEYQKLIKILQRRAK